jgi:hypothetical protein
MRLLVLVSEFVSVFIEATKIFVLLRHSGSYSTARKTQLTIKQLYNWRIFSIHNYSLIYNPNPLVDLLKVV